MVDQTFHRPEATLVADFDVCVSRQLAHFDDVICDHVEILFYEQRLYAMDQVWHVLVQQLWIEVVLPLLFNNLLIEIILHDVVLDVLEFSEFRRERLADGVETVDHKLLIVICVFQEPGREFVARFIVEVLVESFEVMSILFWQVLISSRCCK